MATQFKEYDPSSVVVDLLGNLLEGFAPGVFVKITTPELYADEAGINETARMKLADRRGTVELSFIQTAAANLTLSGIVTLDKGGNGVGPLIISDTSGNTVFFALKAWISKEPDVSYSSNGIEIYNWTLRFSDYTMSVGGN